jgi:YD repeat-containing protein
LNRKIEEIDPAANTYNGTVWMTVSPTTFWSYDPVGNVSSTTDPNTHTTRFFYDVLNRQTCTVSALSTATFSNDFTPASNTVDATFTSFE